MTTIDFATTVEVTKVNPGEVALFWLGQAGFLLKDSHGARFVIDPYLTECGERIRGFKRLSPSIMAPHECQADLYLTTHQHFDHYDYDAVPIAAANPKTLFCGPKSCTDLMLAAGIAPKRVIELAPGSILRHGGIKVTATRADHGEMAPDAIGAMVEMEGTRFYFSGDTAYHAEYMPELAAMQPDVALLSVNGAFGNMNAAEGVKCALALGARCAVPCHFWTFAEHGGTPLAFREGLENTACTPILMRQGERIVFDWTFLNKRRDDNESCTLSGA